MAGCLDCLVILRSYWLGWCERDQTAWWAKEGADGAGYPRQSVQRRQKNATCSPLIAMSLPRLHPLPVNLMSPISFTTLAELIL